MLDAVDKLLVALNAYKSGVYPTNRPQTQLREGLRRGSGGSLGSPSRSQRNESDRGSFEDHSSPISTDRRTPSPRTSDEDQVQASSEPILPQALSDAAGLVAREFLLALRCWKGQIEPDKDFGHLGPGLTEADALVSLVDIGLAAGGSGREEAAHQTWAAIPSAQRNGTSVSGSDGRSVQGDQVSSGSPFPDEGDDSETEEMDPRLRGTPHAPLSELRAGHKPNRPDALGSGAPLDMAGFFRAVKAQLELMHEGLLRGDAVAVREAAAATRLLAESSGSRSIATRALAIEGKAGGGSGLRVADVDALEQQIEAADAIWRSCRITV
jgi:hypothetical protein